MQYIDTHSHLQLSEFDADRDEALSRMREAGVGTMTIGVDFASSEKAVKFAERKPDVWATIGVHPTDTDERFDTVAYEKLLSSKVVAIGECGLDYYRTPRADVFAGQRENFEAQIVFAIAHDLPLMLHVRPSKGTQDAHEDALEMLASHQKSAGDKLRGTAHFFTGSLESARRYWALGFAVSFPGVITFAPECAEVVREAPGDLILSETDSPFAAPVPFRGSRNEPAHVVEVVKKITELRGEDPERSAARLLANARRIFGLEITAQD